MKARHLILGTGLAGALGLVLFGDRTPADEIAEAVVRPAGNSAPARAGHAVPVTAPVILELAPRESLIGGARAEGAKELFASQSWTPLPPPPPPPPPAPAPTAPPLPFTYLGKKIEDGHWEVFLARGEQTLIVRAESAIDANYRVDAIKPPVLTLTYLPLNQVQTLSIGGAE